MPKIMAGSRSATNTTSAVMDRQARSRLYRYARASQLPWDGRSRHGIDDDSGQHGFGQPLEERRQEDQGEQDKDGQEDVGHLALGAGGQRCRGFGEAAGGAHAAQQTGADVAHAVGDKLLVAVQLIVGRFRNFGRCAPAFGEGDQGDDGAAGEQRKPVRGRKSAGNAERGQALWNLGHQIDVGAEKCHHCRSQHDRGQRGGQFWA